jgi:acyl-coenzyme A thioesterase PaaI-like protein
MNAQAILDHALKAMPPYAKGLGIRADHVEAGMPVLAMDFGPRVEGRPGYLHGGASSGLLEIAGYAAMRQHLEVEGRGDAVIKPTGLTVRFLRGAASRTTYARGIITRSGGRLASVEVEAWQIDRDAPVAGANLTFLIAAPDQG